jgi:CubicO group peptidase (beta-lactamase class C family)
MKHINHFFIILLVLCNSLVVAQNNDVELAFQALFESLFSPDEPGGSVLVMKGTQIKFQGNYGIANMETGERITAQTVFNTGSISKTFVSNGILILQERDKLSIDDPISKYFGDFASRKIADKVTIKNLLSHSSGLPDIRNVRDNKTYYLTAKDQENWDPIKKTKKLNFEPGVNFQYSNPAFNGLALIIEQVSGQKWQSFIQTEIFDSAMMKTSKITDGPHPEKGVAHAYVLEDGKYVESDYGEVPTFAAAGNGGVWSNVFELALYEMALRSHKFLSKEMIDESRTVFAPPAWGQTKDPFIGYSWFLGEESLLGTDELGVDIVYHTGSQGGFRAFYISVPEKEIIYIGLFNRPFDAYREVMKIGLSIFKEAGWLD